MFLPPHLYMCCTPPPLHTKTCTCCCSYVFKQQPARMVNDYKGVKVDPAVAAHLRSVWFADSNAALHRMMEEQGDGKTAVAAPA